MAEEVIPKKRLVTENGNIMAVVAWKIPKSTFYPEGLKYSFTLVSGDKRVIGYDNYNNEGHHRHYFNAKEACAFKSLEDTFNRFFEAVKEFEAKGDKNDKGKRAKDIR